MSAEGLQLFPCLHDYTAGSKKNPALGIHVIEAYTEFQQCLCITFEDMNIFLSAIFIFGGLILLLVADTSGISPWVSFHVIFGTTFYAKICMLNISILFPLVHKVNNVIKLNMNIKT